MAPSTHQQQLRSLQCSQLKVCDLQGMLVRHGSSHVLYEKCRSNAIPVLSHADAAMVSAIPDPSHADAAMVNELSCCSKHLLLSLAAEGSGVSSQPVVGTRPISTCELAVHSWCWLRWPHLPAAQLTQCKAAICLQS